MNAKITKAPLKGNERTQFWDSTSGGRLKNTQWHMLGVALNHSRANLIWTSCVSRARLNIVEHMSGMLAHILACSQRDINKSPFIALINVECTTPDALIVTSPSLGQRWRFVSWPWLLLFYGTERHQLDMDLNNIPAYWFTNQMSMNKSINK